MYRYCFHIWTGTAWSLCIVSCCWSVLGGSVSISSSEIQSGRKTQVHPHHHRNNCSISASCSSITPPQEGLCGGQHTNQCLLWTKRCCDILFTNPTTQHHLCYIHFDTCYHVLDNIQGSSRYLKLIKLEALCK